MSRAVKIIIVGLGLYGFAMIGATCMAFDPNAFRAGSQMLAILTAPWSFILGPLLDGTEHEWLAFYAGAPLNAGVFVILVCWFTRVRPGS